MLRHGKSREKRSPSMERPTYITSRLVGSIMHVWAIVSRDDVGHTDNLETILSCSLCCACWWVFTYLDARWTPRPLDYVPSNVSCSRGRLWIKGPHLGSDHSIIFHHLHLHAEGSRILPMGHGGLRLQHGTNFY